MAALFFSYSHKDEELRNELEAHLAMLKRQGIIATWHDRRITAGRDLDDAISHELEEAQIILLLISAHFLNSNYCFDKEMMRALEKHQEGSAVVIPVILHPCDWQSSPFKNLRATPIDGKPVSMYANQHEAFAIVARDVRQAAEQLQAAEPASHPIAALIADNGVDAISRPRSSNLRIKRKFVDHERDEFLEDSFEYIARYFDGSLQELENRNSQIQARYKRLDATSFVASVYQDGKRVAQCSVWFGSGNFGSPGICYSHSSDAPRNSFNESMSVADDGYTLHLKPLGMQYSFSGRQDEAMSQQGAAEYFWSMLVRPLQE